MDKLTKEQIDFLDEVCYTQGVPIPSRIWILNENGEVDVYGNVSIPNRFIRDEIPVKFGRVTGWFDCTHNNLTTLKNIPNFIGGSFYCLFNNLTDYFKNIKEEDFLYWGKLSWEDALNEYPFLINISKKYVNRYSLEYYLKEFPQTKIYLE
jgi:hypothetical protein